MTDTEQTSFPSTSKRTKKRASKSTDAALNSVQGSPKEAPKGTSGTVRDGEPSEEDAPANAGDQGNEDDEENRDDPFRGALFGPGGSHASMSSTLRVLSGYVSGVSQRLREILSNLRQKDDPSVQLIALQELSEILLVSNEDNLAGHFSPDQFVKELIALMQPNEFGEDNSDMMLLACRCIANLMEALPPSTANVVYGGAVPVLCQKLLEINYIDLAEQALSVCYSPSMQKPHCCGNLCSIQI